MRDVIVVREWGTELFHRRVLMLEAQGYVSRLDTYGVTPEMNLETGEIIHLYELELRKPVAALTYE